MTQPGVIALSLVNAGAGPDAQDPLRTPRDATRWLDEMVPVPSTATYAADLPSWPPHREVLAFRASLRALFDRVSTGQRPAEHDVWLLNACLADSASRSLIVLTSDATLGIETIRVALGPRGALGFIAADATRLLEQVDPHKLRRCAADQCARWFVDASKNGGRRWCSMATCGNRAKAARYRQRLAAAS